MVFDACDCDEEGRISLSELANLSRSHTDNQVDQILEIFNIGDQDGDRINFEEFCERMIGFMNNPGSTQENISNPVSGDKAEDLEDVFEEPLGDLNDFRNRINSRTSTSNMNFSPTVSDQGAFNENLKRSFEKTRISVTSSPNNANSLKIKKRASQSKLLGNIPLVNTSSEDEQEDSFDRKIASSLAIARPLDLQQQPQQFLVRGNSLRTTVVRKPKSNTASPNVSASRSRTQSMYPESGSSSTSTSSECSTTNSPSPMRSSAAKTQTLLVVQDLERKVEELAMNRNSSQSSGVDSLKVDLEEEISSSLVMARKHGEERLEAEKRLHSEELDSLGRERDLERRNFQLKFEQMLEEKEMLKKEVTSLRDKVDLLNTEKNLLEDQMIDNVNTLAVKEEADNEEEMRRKDREKELLKTVENLTRKVVDQDQLIAEVKEDNICLKKQLKEVSMKESKGGFRLFGKENVSNKIEDPQVKSISFNELAGFNFCMYVNSLILQDLRSRLRLTEKQLKEQVDVNNQLKAYMGDVLMNVMSSNPQILEKNNKEN